MTSANTGFEILTGGDLHRRVVEQTVLAADRFVWIATANLKDMHIRMARGYRPILESFDRLARDGVSLRIVHCDLPSRRFRSTLDKFPRLVRGGLELQVCPRSHWKIVIVDGRAAYFGSANFTGAGLGAKTEGRRNLEVGFFTEDRGPVRELQAMFDRFWIGNHCVDCGRRELCPDPIVPEQ